MELGLAFDDEDLEENLNRSKETKLISYNAKFCPPMWYNNVETSESQILKYRGDNSYYRKAFAAALGHYEDALDMARLEGITELAQTRDIDKFHGNSTSCLLVLNIEFLETSLPTVHVVKISGEYLDKLSAQNKGMRREIMDCQARCHIGLQQYKEALHLAHALKENASSPDHHMQAELLIAGIHEEAQDWTKMSVAVRQLLCTYPDNAHFWMRLANCYWQQYRQYSHDSPEFCRLITCLVRARLLYRSSLRSVGTFVKEKHKSCLEQIEKQILELSMKEALLQEASQFVSKDMYKLELQDCEDNSGQEQQSPKDIEDFDKRWFSWADNVPHI